MSMADSIMELNLSIKTSTLSELLESAITTEMTGTQSRQNMWLFVCESVSLIIILVVSLVANTVAIATILHMRSLKSTPHYLLVLNLSVADLGIALTSMTFALHSVFDGGFLLQSNPALCKINGFFAVMFTLVNFPTVLSIAIDRFLIVVYSKRFPPNRRRIIIMICTSWAIAFLIALMPALDILSEYSYSPNTWHCSPRWDHSLFRIVCTISIFGLAIPMVAGCYAAIVYFIWTKQRLLRSHSKRELSSYQEQRRLSRNRNSGITSGVNSPMASMQQLPASPTRQPAKASPNLAMNTTPLQACQENQTVDYDTILSDASVEVVKGIPAADLASNHGDATVSATGGCGSRMQLPKVAESASLEEPYTNEQKQKSEKIKEVRQYQLSTDKRVAIMGALLVLTTLICWMPYLLVHSNYVRVSEGHWFAIFTMLLGYLNAVLDPIIYTFMNKRARTECKRYLCYITPPNSCPCSNPMTTRKH